MTEFAPLEGVQCTPSQTKTVRALHVLVIAEHGEGFEYKRFDVYPFSSSKMLEVFIEVGKIEEGALDAIMNRTVRQVFVGERGGCELGNPADSKNRGKVKGLTACMETPTS